MRVASKRTRRAVPYRSWRFAAAANSSRIQAIVERTVRWSVTSPSTKKYRSQLSRGSRPWTTERMKAKWPTCSLRWRAALTPIWLRLDEGIDVPNSGATALCAVYLIAPCPVCATSLCEPLFTAPPATGSSGTLSSRAFITRAASLLKLTGRPGRCRAGCLARPHPLSK